MIKDKAYEAILAREKTMLAAADVELAKRKKLAYSTAKACARILADEFGAQRVILVGSLATGRFRLDSDIDLVVDGIVGERFFAAVARMQDLSPISVDLLDAETLNPTLQTRVATEGVVLHDRP